MYTRTLDKQRWAAIQVILLGLVAISVGIAINMGPASVTMWSIASPQDAIIMWETRLPRVLLALCVGMALGGSGTAYQALLRNPLADPYILGVSGGAALGAAIGVTLQWPFALTMLCAFAVSFACMVGITAVAQHSTAHYTHSLLLTGVVFNAFAFAIILMIHVLAPIEQSHALLLLLMGNLSFADPYTVYVLAVLVVAGLAMLIRHAHALDAISLGEDTAHSLGIHTKHLQLWVFCAGSLLVGAAVAVSGLIGFVGLFIPHTMRLLFGHQHRLLIPAAALAGGSFLVCADTAARSLLASSTAYTELPVGVITALVGAPCFIYLLRKRVRQC